MASESQFTIGVEEEFLIIGADTRAAVPQASRLVPRAREVAGDRVHTELLQSQLETSTEVCDSLAEVRAETSRLRSVLAKVAEEAGARIAAAGSHPFATWAESRVTPQESYLKLEADYGQLTREQLICGCHVHIGIADPEEAIQVMNRVRAWLSPLVALSANSPFWMGVDTAYASYRTEIWRRWPMAGTPEVFASRAEYDDVVRWLLETGSIDAPARIYWDVRPSARFSTLEFRVTDVCLTVDDVVMVAGLVRALVAACHAELVSGQPLVAVRPELLRSATWRAARYGTEGDLVDVVGCRWAPAREVVATMLAFLRPALEDADDWDEVSGLVATTFSRGTGAARQRQAFARNGSLYDVVDFVVAETAGRGGVVSP